MLIQNVYTLIGDFQMYHRDEQETCANANLKLKI